MGSSRQDPASSLLHTGKDKKRLGAGFAFAFSLFQGKSTRISAVIEM